jgi:predicted metal-dependent hydrolase
MNRFALFRAPVDPAHVGAAFALVPPPRVEPTFFDLSRGDVSVRVVLRRHPTARRINLRVRRRNGEVVMTLPNGAEVARARDFAESCFDWIAARLSLLPRPVALVPGSLITLRGEPCLIHAGKAGSAVRQRRMADGSLRLYADPASSAADVRAYIERAAMADLRRSVASYARRLGVTARSIELKDTSSRWGSCSSEGDLCFSWRLALAPHFVLDYLAAHEVGHLRDMSHSAGYWRMVQEVCPHTDAAEDWLRDNDTALYSIG